MPALGVGVSPRDAAPAPPYALLRVRLIGQMEVRAADGRSLLPAGRKTRALFAMLALSAPRSVSRTRAAETLWSRRPTDQARASLRQELHRLLEGLGSLGAQVLDVGRDQIQLRPEACWIDVDALQRASLEDPLPLDLMNGTLLDGLGGVDPVLDAWIQAERERLTDWARTLADRILQAQTEPLQQIEAANRLLAIDRAHEGAWRSLIRAYAAGGDPAMALQAFERCRISLAERLRRSPSPETDQLIAEINGQVIAAPPNPNDTERASAPLEVPAAPVRIGITRIAVADDCPGHGRLATGLTNQLCAALARFRWSSVVCLPHQPAAWPNLAAMREEASIDLLLDGALARVGDFVRVELRLLDLRAGGRLVWSQRFEHDGQDLLALQDEIAGVAAAQLDIEMLAVEVRHAAETPSERPSAYQLTMLSLGCLQTPNRDTLVTAGSLLQRAVAIEPGYALAWASIASWHVIRASQGWVDDPRQNTDAAARAAERAITLDARDARSLSVAGLVAGYLQRRVPESIALNRRALAINPNLPMAWAFGAFSYLFAGDIAAAKQHLGRYKQLAPMLPHAYRYDTAFIFAALLSRDFAEARRWGRDVSALNPAHALPLRPYLAALGHLGAAAEIADVRGRLMKLQPNFCLRWFAAISPFQRPEDNDLIMEGLRLAGVAD